MDSIQMEDDRNMNLITEGDDVVLFGDVSGAIDGGENNRSMPEIVLHRSHSID